MLTNPVDEFAGSDPGPGPTLPTGRGGGA